MTGHRKFAPELSAEAVVERLNREKANSDMIAYALALYEKDATTVVIYVVRAEGRKHREAIKVSPAGFGTATSPSTRSRRRSSTSRWRPPSSN